MTSREATPKLALEFETGVERSPRDLAMLLGFGALQWPWLLKSLYGGRQRAKAALLARLGLDDDALPNLGSWKADVGLLETIVDLINRNRPDNVVELGSGASTLIAARALQLADYGGRLTSYDQHADFVAATRAWLLQHGLAGDLRHAPLVSPTGLWGDLWYDLEAVPETIDLLLIDGPPWTVGPMSRGRAAILFDRVSSGGIVVLDDAARLGERLVAKRWKRDWPMFDWRLVPGIKGTLIGIRA
jgi:predicted O-methyltransferase YrrM